LLSFSEGAHPVRTIVVIPTYCEAENIAGLIDDLLHDRNDLDVLVVDDSSPDGTGRLVEESARRYPPGRVQLLTRPTKNGLGAAYRDGFRRALEERYDLLCQMDADGSHPVVALEAMRDAIDGGADLVLGSRYTRGGRVDPQWPLRRKLISRGGNLYANLMLGSGVADLTGGFKLWRVSTLRELDFGALVANGYAFQIQTTMAALDNGAVVREIPITFIERAHGVSKMHAGIVSEAFTTVLALSVSRLRRPAPARGIADHRVAGEHR
jgi:dolichol-phosphate mannosyltransferase